MRAETEGGHWIQTRSVKVWWQREGLAESWRGSVAATGLSLPSPQASLSLFSVLMGGIFICSVSQTRIGSMCWSQEKRNWKEREWFTCQIYRGWNEWAYHRKHKAHNTHHLSISVPPFYEKDFIKPPFYNEENEAKKN